MKKIKKVINWFIISILIAIIIINFTLIIKSKMNSEEIPDFLGYTPFIIVTGSMEPEIKTGNLIIIQKIINERNLKVGDIISYKSRAENVLITHRIKEIKEVNGIRLYIMKGDSNNLVDKEIITKFDIQGKYKGSIPFIGNIIKCSKEPLSLMMIIVIIISIYIILKFIEKLLKLKTIKFSKIDR